MMITIGHQKSLLHVQNKYAIKVKEDGFILRDMRLFSNSSDYEWEKEIKNLENPNLWLLFFTRIERDMEIGRKQVEIVLIDRFYYEVRTEDKIIKKGYQNKLYADLSRGVVEDTNYFKKVYPKTSRIIKVLPKYSHRKNRIIKGYLNSIMDMWASRGIFHSDEAIALLESAATRLKK